MPDLKRTIEILFQGTNKTGTMISQIGNDLNKLTYSVQNVAAPFVTVTKGVVALDAALVVLAGAGITYSVNKYADFSDVMLKVKGIMGASESQFAQLTALTKDLGATTRYTASEAAQGLEFLAMAGFNFDQAMVALPQTLKLAQASATGLGTTADIVTNIMAGYGIEVKNLASTSDVLTATFTSSNTNLTELGQAFSYVGPVAKAMGLSIEETSAILGVLANNSYKADQGGTALRNILLALAAPMGNTAKLMKELGVDTEEMGIDLAGSANALKSLGVNVKDAEGNLRPFGDIMDDLKAGLEKIPGPADRAAVLVEIFGKRGGPQMAALLNAGSDAVNGLETRIKSLSGVTDKIATQMESDIGGSLRSLRSAFESVALNVGEKFSDGLIQPINSVKDLLRTLSITVDEGMFDNVFEAFKGFGDELAEALDDIAENLPEALEGVDWDGFIDSLGGIGETIRGMFDGLDWDDPQDLQRIIQGIVDSLETLTRFSTQIGEIFFTLAGYIGGLIEKFNSLDQETIATIGKITAVAAAVSALATPVALVTTAIKGLGGVLTLVAANPIVLALVGVGAAIYGVVEASNYLADKLAGVGDISESLGETTGPEKLGDAVAGVADTVDDTAEAMDSMAETSKTDFSRMIRDVEHAGSWTEYLTDEMQKLGILVVEPKIKTGQIEKAAQKFQEIEVWREQTGQWETIKVPIDVTGVEKAKQKVDEIPAVKRLEIETDLEIEKVKAQADTIQKALEFRAEVDIAEIEAAAQTTQTLSTNITQMFAESSQSISSLFSSWDQDASLSKIWVIQDAIRSAEEFQKKSWQMQERLTEAQLQYVKAKTEAAKRGEALITVSGDGLQPHLEMIMWEVFAAIQVRATQEGLDQLLLGA